MGSAAPIEIRGGTDDGMFGGIFQADEGVFGDRFHAEAGVLGETFHADAGVLGFHADDGVADDITPRAIGIFPDSTGISDTAIFAEDA